MVDQGNLDEYFIAGSSPNSPLFRYAEQISRGCDEEASACVESKVSWVLYTYDRKEVMRGSAKGAPGFTIGACRAKANYILDEGSTDDLRNPSFLYTLCCLLPRFTLCSTCCFPESLPFKGAVAIRYEEDTGEIRIGCLAVSGASSGTDVDEAIAEAGMRYAGFTKDPNGFWSLLPVITKEVGVAGAA